MRLREGRARSAVLVRAGPTTWTRCPGLGDVEVREVATSLGRHFLCPSAKCDPSPGKLFLAGYSEGP